MRFLVIIVAAALAAGASACSGDGGNDGPSTVCRYSYATPQQPGTKALGQACATNEECASGVCIQPGDAGNLVNDTFGFCTRGCDCNEDPGSRLTTEEAQLFVCLYPPGEQGRNRHVVVGCATNQDCKDVDPQWIECKALSSGGIKKACHALGG